MYYSNYYLAHHGVVGMKWGVRRYQNEDGSLTDAGRKRYNKDNFKQFRRESMRGKNETEATKRFFDENKDLVGRMQKLSENKRKNDEQYMDLERKRDIAEIKYGEKSKQYKSISKKMESVAKQDDKSFEERASAYDEMLSKGVKFADKTFGEYKNKKLSGLNIRHGKATVEKLFLSDLEQNWYKYVPNEIDDWTRRQLMTTYLVHHGVNGQKWLVSVYHDSK